MISGPVTSSGYMSPETPRNATASPNYDDNSHAIVTSTEDVLTPKPFSSSAHWFHRRHARKHHPRNPHRSLFNSHSSPAGSSSPPSHQSPNSLPQRIVQLAHLQTPLGHWDTQLYAQDLRNFLGQDTEREMAPRTERDDLGSGGPGRVEEDVDGGFNVQCWRSRVCARG